MNTASTRRHPRYLATSRCVVRPLSGQSLIADRVIDMSYSGLRLNALLPVRVGERLKVSLAIPGSSIWMEAEGEVIRKSPARREGDDEPSIGIRLSRMNGFDRVMMANCARSHPRARPTRGAQRDYARIVERIATSR